MVSVVKLRRIAYTTSLTGAVASSLCASYLLRKIHRDALEYVNAVRVSNGETPIEDFPHGVRHLDDHLTPVGKVIDIDACDQAMGDDFLDFVVNTLSGGSAESVFLFYLLFTAGFYSRYNEARLYEKLPPSRLQRFFQSMRDAPSDLTERYYRTKAVVAHVRQELPIRT